MSNLVYIDTHTTYLTQWQSKWRLLGREQSQDSWNSPQRQISSVGGAISHDSSIQRNHSPLPSQIYHQQCCQYWKSARITVDSKRGFEGQVLGVETGGTAEGHNIIHNCTLWGVVSRTCLVRNSGTSSELTPNCVHSSLETPHSDWTSSCDPRPRPHSTSISATITAALPDSTCQRERNTV